WRKANPAEATKRQRTRLILFINLTALTRPSARTNVKKCDCLTCEGGSPTPPGDVGLSRNVDHPLPPGDGRPVTEGGSAAPPGDGRPVTGGGSAAPPSDGRPVTEGGSPAPPGDGACNGRWIGRSAGRWGL